MVNLIKEASIKETMKRSVLTLGNIKSYLTHGAHVSSLGVENHEVHDHH